MEPGYKQTEIGIIPEDWTVRKIGELAKIRMCKRIFAGQTTETGDIPFFKIGTFGGIPDAYISRGIYDEYKAKYSFPSKGDILISAAGTLGRTAVYDGKDAYFQDSNIVWLDIDKKEICNEYLQHYYKIIVWASSEGSTIARLYNGIIESTYIAYPPHTRTGTHRRNPFRRGRADCLAGKADCKKKGHQAGGNAAVADGEDEVAGV